MAVVTSCVGTKNIAWREILSDETVEEPHFTFVPVVTCHVTSGNFYEEKIDFAASPTSPKNIALSRSTFLEAFPVGANSTCRFSRRYFVS